MLNNFESNLNHCRFLEQIYFISLSENRLGFVGVIRWPNLNSEASCNCIIYTILTNFSTQK